MEILLILLDIDRTIENPLVPPSKYFAEMTCNTEDRLQRLKSISRKEKIRKELTLNMLKAIPDIVVFQKYTVGDTLTISVNILNTYETSKPIRVILPPSTVFALTCPSGIITTKVAPGMAYQVNVSFFAHEQKDYRHYLTVISEGESFFIPIICLSHRPLLDIPDQINLPPTPVKTPSERFIIVRNLGEISAAFNIMCSPGFSAYPTRGSINAHDYMQLEVKFVADVIGDHRGRLVLTYETGEKLTVSLKASTYESNVYLEMDALKFLDTYITLRRKMFVKLFNRSKHIVRYAWKKFKTPEMDRLENLKYEEGFKRIQELETKKVTHLMHEGIIAGGDAHDVIYERIYQDELKEYRASDPLLYADSNWSVEPLKGEVWPDNFTIFLLTFSPSEAKYYNTILYLEVSGKEERLPLKLCGTGKGPSLDINVCELDANDIFLCSKHQYEISVRNKGHIPGTIVFVPRPLMFGGTLSCNPAYNHLDPNRYASFVLCFTSNVQGMFVEEIEFKIQESKEDKKIIFRGNIVCPLLNFDVNEVNFGKVALGYPISTYINLINTTQVPIEYIAQFFNDGENPALSCSDYANEVVKPKIHSPKELTFQPEQFIVHPNFTCKGQLTLLPNVEGEWVKRLNIIMWGTAKYSISLPILYVCQIPDIICETQDIFMRGCFVNYTYTRSITIRNRNEHPGYFEFAPCDDEELSDIVFEPKPAEDFIEGYGVKEVELSIYTKHIGQSTLKVYISIFGGPKNLYLCTIRCNGQGPVITVPEVLYFEEIRTLKTITEMLKIVNDSPVPATIAVTHNKKSCCSVSDSCLILNPSESFDLEIKAYVRVPGHFSDKIIFTTEQGESQSCLVKVTAVGSSILCVPEIEPEIDIGTVLTHQTFVMHLKFTNMGRKHHKIIWNRLKRLKSFRDDPSLSPPSVFSIKPNVFELAPDQSIDCDLSGYGTHVGHFEEDFYCHAIIEGRKDYAVITSFIVIAQLARPMLKMSHVELNFRIDNGVDKTIAFLKDTMTIKNISGLAITTSIRTEDPFYLISPNSREQFIERHLENKDVFTFDVEFAPKAMRKECIVWNKELVFTYLGHPAQDKVPIRAEENFPSLEIQPITIDFDCLPNFFSTSAELIVKNVSPLPLTFQWEWIREKIEVDTIAHVPINVPTYTSEETINISSISEPTIPSEDNIPPLTGIEECEMECENLHRLLEIDVVRPPIMTAELINAPPAERAIISNVDRTPEYEEELQVILYQLIKHYDGSQLEIEALKCLPDLGDKCDHCCELFDLVPTYGYLGPYEAQMVSIEFCPHPNTSVTAVAHCHPSGGETEVLQLTGKSSNISFSIDSDVIEFGRQLFCEFCEQTMIIKNTGSAPLQIEPFQNKAPEAELAGSLPPPNWYNVNLSEFSRDYEIRVRYFPGLTKEFTQKFSLQIAYLPAYTFTIHGFGVLQQIFCALPRPSLNDEVTNFLSYRAIASITSSFLKDVKSLTQIDMKFKGDIPYNVREVLKSDDWVIISFNDDYPTIADIQMAVERCMVDIYVSANYSILYDHTIMRNMSIASNKLVAPPYLIDFGYVIKDTDVHYTAIIQNYGPSIANIRVVWSRKMATKLGLRAKLARNSLQVGASTELSVTFGPTTKIYSTKSCTVSEAIFILVSHGQKVPIEVRAYVTVPVVTMNEKCVNFNEITLGCCSRKDIILENTGFVPCQWESKIEMDQKYGTKSVFHSQTTSGILKVGQKRLLDLNFEPNKGGKFRAFLIIIIEQNPNNVMLRLKGCGVKPSLKISETKLEFPSTLPYTENIEIAFTIENISPTPIEFFFSDFDEEAITEDLIVTTLTEYYRSNSLYIPHKKPGEGFPAKIMEFYNNLLKSVRELFSAETESVSTSEMSDKTAKRKESGGVKPLNSADKETPSSKPLEEMESLLKDQIRFLKRTSTSTCDISPQDPVGDAIEDALKKSRFKLPTDFRNGIFIIFHGAPQTDYVRAANRAGLVLKLPVISVDRLFFDALIRPATLAAIKIRQILDESYFSVASDTDLRAPPDYDEYDYLQRKIEVLLSGKKKKPTKRSGTKESKSERKTSATSKKSSKKSSKSDKEGKEKGKAKEKKESKTKKASVTTTTESTAGTGKTKVDKRPTLIGLSEELLYQIIESQLATYDRGVIIESLESMFVRRPLMLFNWLLKEKLQSDVDNTEDKAAKIQEIMDMNAEDYANLPLADKLLFKEEVISRRKEKSQKKHDELLHRIAEKQEKILKKKGKRSSKQGKLRSTSRLGLVEKDTKKAKKSKSGSHSKKSSKSSKITKSSKTSKGSKKDKKGKKKEKVKSQEHDMKKLFIDSENVIWEMLHILEYWDRQNGILTKPVPARTASQQSSRKSKSAQKSSASSKRSTDRKLEVVDGQEEVVKTYSPEELGHICYKGVPCWLIDNAHKGTDPFLAERIASYLQQTPQLLEAQGEIENSFLPKLEENNILLSVIRKPTVKREKVPAGVFALFDVDVTPPKLPIQEQTPTKPSKRRSFSKRSKYSTTSLDATSNISLKYSTTRGVIKVKEVPNESKLTSRNVIEPGSKYTYKIAFTPTCVGLYTVTFTIEIVGWPTIYYIECKGKCEVPGFNLRPSVMFEKVIDNREEGKIYDNCVYFLDEKSLDFGTDLLPLYKEVKEKTLETSTVFKLVNELSQTCEIEIFLTEDRISSGVFSLEPTILSIPPQESKDVFARAKPCLPGKFSGIALMLVKNNPEIYAVQLKSSAINVSVAFEPKYIEFERTTLNCRTKKTAQLMNLSPVPILWKVVDDDDILTTFKIRPLSSRIEAYSHQKIDFTFKPLDTVDIPNKYLRVLVYNAYHDFSIPLCTESIAISAEVINVYIECPKEINFGEIKGRMAHVYNYQILSKIKYTMDFVFTDVIPSTAENRAIRKLFQAYPQQLQLKYGKVANANIVFFPKHFVDFVNIPIFHCMVIDPATKNIVTSFDITATATAHFSRFKFCPVEEIDFGHQLLGCEKTEPIALENTGRFDFNYVITSFTKMMAEKNKKKKQKDKKGKKGKKGGKDKGKKTKSSSEKSKSTSKKTKSTEKSKSSKSTKSTKSSKKKESRKSKKGKRSPDKKPKPKPTKLNIGCFNIISSTGILEPGESVLVNVTTKPKKIGVFQEKILIFISECESAYKKGIEILLQVTGVLPKYNFGNIRDIFSEQYVVETMADFNCPEQINNNQIFVIAENTLHLNKVGINSVCETHIKVQSISVVTTSLAASLDDNINFSIHPNIATTEAYGYALFTITFKPTAIQAYECTLNLSYITADSTTSNSEGQFTITITGEGCVPEIAIIKPELDPRDNSCNLIFNPLLVGEVGESTIVIESICPIWCKVIAEITHDTTNMLSLFSDQIQVADFNSRKDLNKMNVDTSTSNNKIASHAIVKLEPYGKASLRVVFKPFDEVSTTALLKLRIINNPYEAYCVNIRIESFLEDIVINGLKAASFFNQNRPVHVVSRYELDLGYCTLKTIKNKRFTISNNSKVFTYRFQFPSFKKLKFSPTTGHLKPATSKQVLVTFFARSTINFVEVHIFDGSRYTYTRLRMPGLSPRKQSWNFLPFPNPAFVYSVTEAKAECVDVNHAGCHFLGSHKDNNYIELVTSYSIISEASDEILQCTICKIQYVKQDNEPLSWDDRQNVVIWKPSSQASLIEPRNLSAPSSGRRVSRKSSLKLRKKSADDISSMRKSSTLLKTSSKKSITSLKKSATDTRKSKGDKSGGNVKEKTIESKPEPPYIELLETMRTIELLLSIAADYCAYKSSVSQITMEDTLMFEKRTAAFEITNTSVMPLTLNWLVNMNECYPRRINVNGSGLVAGVDKHGRDSLANIVQPRLVQSAKHRPVYLTGNEKFVSGTCTPIESVRSSTIFSDDGSLTNRSRDSWHENDYMPFAVEPCTYTIPPLGTKEFKIIFSPIDVFEYLVHLYSTIPNLHPQDTDLEIVVEAKSLLPLYHFDIMPTNYLMRRPPLICGDLADNNTKVVEFDAVGLNIQHVRKFNVINPTGESFDFKWKPVQFMNNDISLFHCNTPDGSVAKGKMAESSFTFIPQRHGTFEAFYIFTIEKYNIDTTFLLSGVARNPCVFFSSSHLSLKGTLVNLEVTETVILQNNEGVPLDFDFKKTSLLNNDRTRKITVEPMSSTLKPNSKLPISLTFKASQTGEVDFRLKCNVEKMNKPLTLLVTTNVYDVELELVYLNGNRRLILDPKSVNTIELKSLVVLEKDSAHFQIINNGKIGFYYNWQCVEKCSEEYAVVKFDNADGYCLCSVETSTAVTIQPTRQLTQKRFKIMLQILYGPKYIIYFICTTAKASYKFSFNEYNFGNCLLQPEKTTYYSCILEFTNFDQQSITLEYNGEMDNNFSIAFKSKPIPPKEVEKIPIYFHPIEAGNYKFDFKFFINSKVDVVTVKGVGTPLIIELVDQEQKFINLGAVLAGKQVTKTVQVVNRSNCKIYAAFDLYNRLPIHSKPRRIVEPEYERKDVEKKPESKKGKKGKKDKKKGKKGSKGSKKSSKSSKTTKTSKSSKSSKSKKSKSSKSSKKSGTTKSSGSKGKKGKKDKQDKLPTPPEAHVETAKERMERLITESIEITPKKFIKMLPNSTCSFTITFSPKEKMVSFTRKMFYQVQDRTEPLCLIKGSSIAADYYLDKQKIAFGAVVKGCSTSLKFTLFNTGDIGGRYKWKFEKFEPSITIEPSEGYISPDMSVTFTAKYHPKAVLCSATARAKCNVEHYQKTLRMEFTGSCVKKPTAIATLKFSCPVRTQTFQEVTIDNTNSELWIVNPKIIGSDFAAQEVVNVPPVSKTSFQVKFSPTTMSKGQPHKATLHLVLPNGHCTIYNLEGIAQTPLAIDKIERDIYCKRQFNEAFEIQNWLKLPQQFKVITKNLKPNETKLILYKTTGNATIDVPASGKRQYNWGIFVMNVGKLNFQVIFQNETTEEYMFYEIILNVKQGGPLEEIKLKTCVRTPTVYKLKLENPLKKVVVFNISSNCDKLEYEKSIPLDPCAERIVDICFTPLLPGVTDANLEIMTNEMGVFLYHFNLQANDPLPEPPVIFKCPLGQSVTRKISLYNSCKTKADFRVKLQDRDIFSVDSETFSTQSGATLCLPVTFEPNILGNVQSSLTLTSQAIGQYTYPLIGTCTNPIPQGPIFVKLGGSTTLTFKNPFEEEKNFLLKAEPDVFQVKPIMETVYGRRTMKVIVSTFNAKCDIIDNRVIPYTGKLTITFADCPTPNLKWVFYLQSDIRRTPSAPNN